MKHKLVLLFFSVLFSSCSTTSYLWQAGRGQFKIFNSQKPLDEVMKDPTVSDRTKDHLKRVSKYKDFMNSQGFEATENYSSYVSWDSPYVTYIVSASKKNELKAHLWSFPIAGKVPYLGFFDRKDAEEEASKFELEGWDAWVRGVTAYSTLGWFSDPLLSTMISPDESSYARLMELIFHESVHATVYIPGNSNYNESLADLIAEKLVDRYSPNMDQVEKGSFLIYEKQKKFYEEKKKLILQAIQNLKEIYESKTLSDEDKIKKREEVFLGSKENLSMNQKPNNAFFIQFLTYEDEKENLEIMFQYCDQDISKMMALQKKIADEEPAGSVRDWLKIQWVKDCEG